MAPGDVKVTSTLAPGLAGVTTSMDEMVARRFSAAPCAQLYSQVRSVGWQAWLTSQMQVAPTADTTMDSYLSARLPMLTMNLTEASAFAASIGYGFSGVPIMAAQFARRGSMLVRQLMSERHLNESLYEFWMDHFSVPFVDKGNNSHGATLSLDLALRKVACTTVGQVIKLFYTNPKLYYYLDNNLNNAPVVNQNLARETLELFTIGVGNYTETDVQQLSVLLSGWIDNSAGLAGPVTLQGKHLFTANDVVVLGRAYPNATQTQAEASWWKFVDDMIADPRTWRFISTKLARRYVCDNPPASLIDQMVSTWRTTGGSIPQLIWTMVKSPEFAASAANKWKRPVEYFNSFHRTAGCHWELRPAERDRTYASWCVYNPVEGYRRWLNLAGHEPRTWLAPNGFPDKAESWTGSTSLLQELNVALAGRTVDPVELPPAGSWSAVLPVLSGNVDQQATQLVRALTGFTPTVAIRAAVAAKLSNTLLDATGRLDAAVRTVYASPLAWLR